MPDALWSPRPLATWPFLKCPSKVLDLTHSFPLISVSLSSRGKMGQTNKKLSLGWHTEALVELLRRTGQRGGSANLWSRLWGWPCPSPWGLQLHPLLLVSRGAAGLSGAIVVDGTGGLSRPGGNGEGWRGNRAQADNLEARGRWGHVRESSQWGTGVPGAQRRSRLRSAAVSQIQAPLNRTTYLFHMLGSESISNFQKISSPRG